jgi:hypothetical protein
MDSNWLDYLTRLIGSRRRALSLLSGVTLLGLGSEVSGRKKNRKKCKSKRFKICTGNNCVNGKKCGKPFNCTCRGEQTCLANGSCGIACPTACPQEPYACSCRASGDQFCVRDDWTCEQTPTSCASIDDCLTGYACVETTCGPGGAEKHCVPLCHPPR